MNLLDFEPTGESLFAPPADPVNQSLVDDIVESLPDSRFANLETMDFEQLAGNGTVSRKAHAPEPCCCCGETLALVILALAAIGAWVVIKRIVEN